MTEPNFIDAVTFWNAYFQDRLSRCYVHSDRISVSIEVVTPGRSLLQLERKVEVGEVPFSLLRSYDYDEDARFASINGLPKTVAQSLSLLAALSYPYRDPPPFGSQRMSELAKLTLSSFGELNDSKLNALLENWIVNREEDEQLIRGLTWLCGERREAIYAPTLVAMLAYGPTVEPKTAKSLPGTLVDTVFEALWKINPKAQLLDVIDIMARSGYSGRIKIGALLSRLLSRERLLSLDELGELFWDEGYWREKITPYKGFEPSDWLEYDSKALYWEVRLQAAKKMSQGSDVLKAMREDFVKLVAEAATARLGQ
jgi:hypothetical protein